MEARLTTIRETLKDFRSDFWVCGKCKLCQANHVKEVEHARFWRNCPSGTRFRYEAYYASGKMEIAKAMELGEVEPSDAVAHVIYSCNLCGSCQEQCYPVKQMFPTRVIELLREEAVREGWGPLPEHKPIIDNLEKHDNMLGKPQKDRGKWAKDLGLKDASKEKADVLLFAGCKYSFQPELNSAARGAVEALKATGADIGILGAEELCCGAPLLELGDRDFFEQFAAENIKRINATGASLVVTLCPHCSWVFAEEYAPHLEAEVKHASQVLAEALGEGKIKPSKEVSASVAWHDPCRLGRRLGVYEPPREILSAIPGLEWKELERHHGNSLCCGAGGLADYAFPDYGEWVAKERVFEAEFVEAERIVTSCPWCEELLARGAKGKGSKVKVDNIFTLLGESLGGDVR
ncbi:MAG: (Fe-S)-binding protein [Actinobacteria bacterium]|nr:(Fe-S)-binding protein [Actinomycetota bacterium]